MLHWQNKMETRSSSSCGFTRWTMLPAPGDTFHWWSQAASIGNVYSRHEQVSEDCARFQRLDEVSVGIWTRGWYGILHAFSALTHSINRRTLCCYDLRLWQAHVVALRGGPTLAVHGGVALFWDPGKDTRDIFSGRQRRLTKDSILTQLEDKTFNVSGILWAYQ